jgi:hypothetical protein
LGSFGSSRRGRRRSAASLRQGCSPVTGRSGRRPWRGLWARAASRAAKFDSGIPLPGASEIGVDFSENRQRGRAEVSGGKGSGDTVGGRVQPDIWSAVVRYAVGAAQGRDKAVNQGNSRWPPTASPGKVGMSAWRPIGFKERVYPFRFRIPPKGAPVHNSCNSGPPPPAAANPNRALHHLRMAFAKRSPRQ